MNEEVQHLSTVTMPGQDRVKQLESKITVYEQRHTTQTAEINDLKQQIEHGVHQLKAAMQALDECQTQARTYVELLTVIQRVGYVPETLTNLVLESQSLPLMARDDSEDYNEWEEG